MPIRKKNVSASFAVFLNTFLIISTVIVFAVLLFLSYENMFNQKIYECVSHTEQTCRYVASDIQNIAGDYPDAFSEDAPFYEIEGLNKSINMYVKSDIYSENGDIYIVGENGYIYYCSIPDVQGDYLADETALSLVRNSSESQSTISDRNTDFYYSMSCVKIEGTSMYSFVADSFLINEINQEYISVILLPAAVSMLAAVALFIGFVGLTVKPVREISKVTTKVTGGDYSVRVPEKYTKDDDFSSITVSSDIAELARAVNTMTEALENQEKDRNVFISSIAHDIRTPLTSINGFITAMLDGTIPPENSEKYLLMIKQEVDRIRKLIVSMTEASSLSHVDPEMMESFNVKEVIEDISENLQPQLSEKNITLTTELDQLTSPMAYGDSQLLCRVLINIVTNAIKFTPQSGKINVGAASDDKEKKIVLTVEDSGPGVEPEKRTRIFESFYKGDPSRKVEGFGLGLYICKQILAGHGQSIFVDESEKLGGARFTFTFPYPPVEKK
ncbi:MAG: HAMP domain-containing histidine kinase [Clostridiales bacterium]|nr:HAMP domain-containing histidine kinase [Clostridiales bacterium]